MAKRIQIAERLKGALRQDESWWTLVVEDDGTKSVEHEWSRVDPFGRSAPSEGKEIIAFDAFLAGEYPEALKAKARALAV